MKRAVDLPLLVRWIISVGCIFLLLMTLMRIAMFLFFNNQGYSFPDLADAFLLGLRFDLRGVGLILLIMLILGSLKPLNPFRTGFAQKLWFVLLGFFAVIFLFFY